MKPTRRQFVATISSLPVFSAPAWAAGREIACDVAVLGGGVGGCAAALAACRSGLRVVMTEETRWIGGQLTAQAVPPDEHPWIEMFGCTASYRAFRNGVRQYYRDHYPLLAPHRANPRLNPGGGSVSALTHEPRVALAVLQAMLQPYLASGRLALFTEALPLRADTDGDLVRAVAIRDSSGVERIVRAAYFLDATETGELLPMTGTEFVTGAESRGQTGELHAPETARPDNHQAFTVCFALGYDAEADHTIDRPAEYAFWRDYVPELRPPWPGRLLSWSMSDPVTLKPRNVFFDPTLQARQPGLNLWLYRRIVRKDLYEPGFCRTDVTLVNWPQNDYWLGNLYGVPEQEAARHLERARQLSLSLLYWMQTEAPRPDGGAGWRGLHLRPDITGTADGLAMYPYIRESRRIQAEFTVLEQHVGAEARQKLTGKPPEELTAEPFADSVGVGSYRIDLHPSSGGDNYIDVSSLPFQIPLGALIPKRMENLLPAAKNLGVTHITNGCYRLHPVEWNVGESAGALAAHCVRRRLRPRQVRNTAKLLREFQDSLVEQGVEIAWPKLRPR
ncbi:MAG: FAD-dependent oxidoreductase [Bryobacteraceae bacterium]|nr:MAG: FAD-dependent oxidoreductase [Bryobacteraceae bacterium]